MMNRLKFLTYALTGLALAVIPKTAGGSCPPTADTPPTPVHPVPKGKRIPTEAGHVYFPWGQPENVSVPEHESIGNVMGCPTCKSAACSGCNPVSVRSGLHCHFDSIVWAKEFKRLFPDSDEDLMHTWFANAIMCGYDYGRRQDLAGEQEEARQ